MVGTGNSPRLLSWGEGTESLLLRIFTHGTGFRASPSQWPHFPPQIRPQSTGWQAWEWLRSGPSQVPLFSLPCPHSRAAQVVPGFPWGPGTEHPCPHPSPEGPTAAVQTGWCDHARHRGAQCKRDLGNARAVCVAWVQSKGLIFENALLLNLPKILL